MMVTPAGKGMPGQHRTADPGRADADSGGADGSGADLKAALVKRARDLGFARVGVARAERLSLEADQLSAWLAAGRHGDMDYMARTEEVRADPCHAGMLPSARSVVVLVTPYARSEPAEAGAAGVSRVGRIARYARGRDYHNVLHKRLRKLSAQLREEGHTVRAAVDSMPVLERAWAERAGVGFVGKNCCLIVPGLGSHVFLSALVTSAAMPADAAMTRRCGSCDACLRACPTQAFVGPRQLDARRCISYLTIEHRADIEASLRPGMEDWLFGCDACQDVCPFNRTRPVDPAETEPFAARDYPDAAGFLALDTDAFAALAVGSPLKRAGRAGLARNAAIVLGNRGDRRALPVLQQAAERDPEDIVRRAAQWALERLGQRPPQ